MRGFPSYSALYPPLPLCTMTHLMTLCFGGMTPDFLQRMPDFVLEGKHNEPHRSRLLALPVALFPAFVHNNQGVLWCRGAVVQQNRRTEYTRIIVKMSNEHSAFHAYFPMGADRVE